MCKIFKRILNKYLLSKVKMNYKSIYILKSASNFIYFGNTIHIGTIT